MRDTQSSRRPGVHTAPTATAARLPLLYHPRARVPCRRAMPMPKKTCTACGAKCSIGLKVCACGLKFKSKSITNWAGVKVPPKARRTE